MTWTAPWLGKEMLILGNALVLGFAAVALACLIKRLGRLHALYFGGGRPIVIEIGLQTIHSMGSSNIGLSFREGALHGQIRGCDQDESYQCKKGNSGNWFRHVHSLSRRAGWR